MIRHLRVRDFVLIEELELELDVGFYALTGETGAGKSVIARAVELLRGGRARAETVRHGAEEAVVEAVGPDRYHMDLELPENAFRFRRAVSAAG